MASAESAVIAVLLVDAGVTALAADRVFVHGARQGSGEPYVSLVRISTGSAGHLDGGARLEWPRLQIDCWAMTALAALGLAEAVRAAIDAVPAVGDGLSFIATFQDQRGPAPDELTRNFRVSQDYFVWYERN